MQNRKGIPMNETSKAEWEKGLKDVEESIDALYTEREKQNTKYKMMKQQELF